MTTSVSIKTQEKNYMSEEVNESNWEEVDSSTEPSSFGTKSRKH